LSTDTNIRQEQTTFCMTARQTVQQQRYYKQLISWAVSTLSITWFTY